MVMHSEIPEFPFQVGPLSSPPSEYSERRGSCPFGQVRLRSGHEAVLLVRFADAVAALGDIRLTHDLTAPGSPRLAHGRSFRDDPEVILNMEGEQHRRLRRIMAPALSPRSAERWRPAIRSVVAELIDRMEQNGTEADIVEDFCSPMPVRVIGKLLGVPDEDTGRFQRWSDAFALAEEISDQEREERLGEFAQYIAELVAARRAEPGTGLIDEMIAARDGADRLSESELTFLVMSLIVGGTHTTSNALARGLLTLLRDDRVLWRQVVDQPDIIPAAVEELLRFDALGDLLMLREATEDIELPSVTVRKGSAVVVSVLSALRDEAEYPDPETVRFDRGDSWPLIFGAGPHFCPGAHLARAELQIALGLLAERLPELRPAAHLDTLRFTEGEELSSLVSLPVAWK